MLRKARAALTKIGPSHASQLPLHTSEMSGVFSPDCSLLLTADGRTIHMWQVESPEWHSEA
jgi:hypothetical protein